jgi:hypothetical protein
MENVKVVAILIILIIFMGWFFLSDRSAESVSQVIQNLVMFGIQLPWGVYVAAAIITILTIAKTKNKI